MAGDRVNGYEEPAAPAVVHEPLADPFRADQVSRGAGEFLGGWDALQPSVRRGQVPWISLDTRQEVSNWSRTELLRAVRWLRNTGLVAGLIKNAANLIGTLKPSAQSEDEEWNELANEAFVSQAGAKAVFDAGGKFNFFTAQPMLNRAALGDGDMLSVLTEGPGGRARVAFYESHQIVSPKDAGSDWHDGVRLGRNSRHVAYGVRDEEGEAVVRIPARDAMLYGFWERPGHVRPLPPLTHAITTAVDIVEMRGDLKHGLKVNNLASAYRVKKNGPGARSGGGGLPAAAAERLAKTGTKTVDGTKDVKVALQDAYAGGMMPQLEPDESIQLVVDPRPHGNQRDFINDDLIRDIAVGFELMPELVWKLMGLNGPEMRYVLAVLERWIRNRLREQHEWCHRYWVYHIAKEVRQGRLRACRDEGWMRRSRVRYQRELSLTIDRGREGKERREALRDGIGTEEDLYEEFGGDGGFKAQARARDKEIRFKKQLADEGGYPVEWVLPNQKTTMREGRGEEDGGGE